MDCINYVVSLLPVLIIKTILKYNSNCYSLHIVLVFATVDIISAIEFDKSGDYLATGDRGGRVVLFERTDTKDVYIYILINVNMVL